MTTAFSFSLLQSRLARRMLGLFVLCALVPATILDGSRTTKSQISCSFKHQTVSGSRAKPREWCSTTIS